VQVTRSTPVLDDVVVPDLHCCALPRSCLDSLAVRVRSHNQRACMPHPDPGIHYEYRISPVKGWEKRFSKSRCPHIPCRMKRKDLASGEFAGDYFGTGNFTSTGAYPGFCTMAGVVTTHRFRHRVHEASRATLKWSRGVLLTIWFSALHWGQVNRMTYPDLVPAISGFTDEFFIDLLFLVFSLADGPGHGGRYGPPYRKYWKKAGDEFLCPAVPGGTGSKAVYDTCTIGGPKV